MIYCKAESCKYNVERSCSLTSIEINDNYECSMFCYNDSVDCGLKNSEGLLECPNCNSYPILRKVKKNKFFYECGGDCWRQTDKFPTVEEAKRAWISMKDKRYLYD